MANYYINQAKIQGYLRLTRPGNALAVLLGYAIGSYWNRPPSDYVSFLIGIAVLMLLHSAATVQNDLQDIEIDKANHRHTALLDKQISQKQAADLAIILVVASLAISLLAGNRIINLAFVAGFALLAWLYNTKPFFISRRPISSIIVMGLCYGALPIAYGLAVSDSINSKGAAVLIVLWFIQRVSTSILKDFKDAKGDSLLDKRTFYLTYGRIATIWVSFIFCLIAYVGVLSMLLIAHNLNLLSGIIFSVAVGLAVRNVIARSKLLHETSETKLAKIFSQAFAYQNQFDLVILICLVSLR